MVRVCEFGFQKHPGLPRKRRGKASTGVKTGRFRVIHSTVVTAQGHMGETKGRSKFRGKNTLYKEGDKRERSGEAMEERRTMDVVPLNS